MNTCLRTVAGLLLVAALPLPVAGHGADVDQAPRIIVETINPWTSLDLNNDPNSFQFAIVSDRTGGMRPGILADAIGKLNLLQPEFVMSVGDMIGGYTEDQATIDAEWAEFDHLISGLEMPFFYVPGNHDITNATMARDWAERRGRAYYHFVYRDVLFLCLNSEGPPANQLSSEQLDYVERALAENPEVRWTLAFLHKPLWNYEGETGWSRFEEMVGDREHTVFAGHVHSYTKYERHGANYFVLATTGGSSSLRGPLFGEFDHVVWVTMTDAGPRIANLMLDGIFDENVRTEEAADLVEQILGGAAISEKTIFADGDRFKSAATQLRLTNDADVPMRITGLFAGNSTLSIEPEEIDVALPPNSVELIPLTVVARQRGARVSALSPVQLGWRATVALADGEPMVLDGQSAVVVERRFECRKGRRKTVDGDLRDWKKLPLVCEQPAQFRGALDSWKGPADASFRFGVEYDDEFLYVAVEVTDECHTHDPEREPWNQDGVEIRVDARPAPIRDRTRGGGEFTDHALVAVSPGGGGDEMVIFKPETVRETGIAVASRVTATGHNTEISIPVSWLNEKQGREWEDFRLTVTADDYDDIHGPMAQLWWRPRWNTEGDYAGSGTFTRR